MSLAGIYNACMEMQNDPAGSMLKDFENINPTKITLDLIARESPRCVEVAKRLGVDLKDLLVAENYRYAVSLISKDTSRKEQKLKNYDYNGNKKIFLLRQAANRVEDNDKLYNYTAYFSGYFNIFKNRVIREFDELKKV